VTSNVELDPFPQSLADAQMTEISGAELQPGTEVVTNVTSETQPVRSATNPFPTGGFGGNARGR
jgi:hypothetical protein